MSDFPWAGIELKTFTCGHTEIAVVGAPYRLLCPSCAAYYAQAFGVTDPQRQAEIWQELHPHAQAVNDHPQQDQV